MGLFRDFSRDSSNIFTNNSSVDLSRNQVFPRSSCRFSLGILLGNSSRIRPMIMQGIPLGRDFSLDIRPENPLGIHIKTADTCTHTLRSIPSLLLRKLFLSFFLGYVQDFFRSSF